MDKIGEPQTRVILLTIIIGILITLSLSSISAGYSRTNFYSPMGGIGSFTGGFFGQTPGQFDRSMCEAGQDFVLQIAPFGCSPAIVRSDLLEEQNVPVYCQIAATQINPLIDVKAIDYMTFSGQTPPEVAGVGFHPNKAALGTGRKSTLENYPILDNIGYAVIVLKKQSNESQMPNYVEGNLTAKIRYNIENAWGVGQATYYLPLLDANEFEDKYKSYGFWDGRGFLKAESIENDGATISIYAGRTGTSGELQKLNEVSLAEGKTSDKIYMTGFNYCLANLRLRLDGVEYPDTRAKIKVNADVYEVADREKFLEGRCEVLNIEKYGINEEVEIKCKEDANSGTLGSKPFVLKNSPKVELEINGETNKFGLGDKVYESKNKRGVYVAYIGSADNSADVKSLQMYLVEVKGQGERLSDEKINFISAYLGGRFEKSKSNTPTKGAILDFAVAIVDFAAQGIGEATEKTYELAQDENLQFFHYSDPIDFVGSKVTLKGFGSAVDATLDAETLEYYQRAMDDYDEVLSSFASETYNSVELGKQSLAKKIEFAFSMQQKKTMMDLCEQYSEAFPDSVVPEKCSKPSQLSNEDSSARHVTINGDVKEVSFEGSYRPGYKEYGVEGYAIDHKTGKSISFSLRKYEIKYLDQEAAEFVQLAEIKDENTVSIILKATTVGARETLRTQGRPITVTFKKGVPQIPVGNYEITIQKINIQRVAKVSVLPNIDYAGTETTFKFKIGIQKRDALLKLSPQEAQEKIKSLDGDIKRWEDISSKIGNVVKGLKTACLATGALFTVDNLLSNMDGKGIARQKVMRGTGGWYEQCDKWVREKAVIDGDTYSTRQECLFSNSKRIDEEVEEYYNTQSRQDENIKKLYNVIDGGGFFSEDVINSTELILDYSKQVTSALDGCAGNEIKNPLKTDEKINVADVQEALSFGSWNKNKNYNLQELKDIGFYCDVLKKNPADPRAQQRLYSLLYNVNENYKGYAETQTYATKLGLSSTQVGFIELGKTKPYNYLGATYKDISSEVEISGVSPDDPIYVAGTNKGNYILILDSSSLTNNLPIKKNGEVFLVYNSEGTLIDGKDLPAEFKGQIYFTKLSSTSYNNKYNNPEIKYFETDPFKGAPALVPIDTQEGWYVAMRQTLPGFGNIRSYDESGRVYSYYLGNTMTNGEVDIFSGAGDDVSQLIVLGSRETFSQFPGLSDAKVSTLIRKAENAIAEVQRKYSPGVRSVNVPDVGNVKVGNPAVNVPQVECEDFMSPSQCQILFNVCDPVICPSSRCDMGGAYPVADVVQSGVIGSVALCLPNLQEGIIIPVCLTGIKAGIDNWASIQKSYKSCLQEQLETGKTVGICDEIQSIYGCEFFWRQSLPIAKIIIPTVISTVLGQNVRGGGEYLGVANAWDNAEKSIQYFTQIYGEDSFKAFKARSTEEVGGQLCKSFVSGVYPSSGNFLDTLTEADSPPQFTGRFDEIPFTTATNPPVSHYKVFYHIFAGKDSGAYFRVYLKGSPGSSYYQDTAISRVVAYDYIPRGEPATDTVDFTAPSGYNQLCILVNGQEECGFKQVSTDFAVNYLQDKYLSSQANDTVTSEAACISGTPSLYSMLNPNLQEGATDVINPELYNQGIYRICATNNPGTGTDGVLGTQSQRWVDVGYCGDQRLRCWLDTRSVKDVIKNLDIENETLSGINAQVQANLEANGQAPNIKDTIAKIENTPGDIEKIKIINDVIGKFFFNVHKGRLLIERADAYGRLAFKLFAEKNKKQTAAECVKTPAGKIFRVQDILRNFKTAEEADKWCNENGGIAICEGKPGAFTGIKISVLIDCQQTETSDTSGDEEPSDTGDQSDETASGEGPVLPDPTQVDSRFADTQLFTRLNLYNTLIKEASTKYGINEELIKAIIIQESYADPNAKGDDGKSLGLMQVSAIAALDVKQHYNDNEHNSLYLQYQSNPYSPATNVKIGTAFLKRLSDYYSAKGNSGEELTMISLVAYNSGMGNVNEKCADGKWENCENLPTITMQYVSNIVAYDKKLRGESLGGSSTQKYTIDSALQAIKGKTGDYSDNKEFIDALYTSGVLTAEEYNEINGNGLFNLEENMKYVEDLLTKKKGNNLASSPATGKTILEVKTTSGEPVSGSVVVAAEYLPVISIQDYLASQNPIEIPLKIETVQIFTQEDKAEIEVLQDNEQLTEEPLIREGLDFDEIVPKEFETADKLPAETLKLDADDINSILQKNDIGEKEIIIGLEMSPKPLPPTGEIEISNDLSEEGILFIKDKSGEKLIEIPLDQLKNGEATLCEDVKENQVAKLDGSKFKCSPTSYCREGFNLGELNCGAGNSCCRPTCETSFSGFECTDTTRFTCQGDIKRGYCSGGNEIVCCQKGISATVTGSSEFTSYPSINRKILEIINGDKSFASNLQVCEGVNCAGFVSVTFDYLFGNGRRFINGVYGNAWDIPENVESLGDGSYTFYDWEQGNIFANYDLLRPGDLIGFHYTQSDYLPEKKGLSLGNTPEIDFTHIALYLGEKNNEHYIAHLYHVPSSLRNSRDTFDSSGVRAESIEDFLTLYGSYFKIRAVMKLNQDNLYKEPPIYQTQEYTAKSGDSVLGIASSINTGLSTQENAWLIAYYNSIFEPNYLNAGQRIFVPTSKIIASSSGNTGYSNIVSSLAVKINQKYDKDNDDDFGYGWARTIYDTAEYKDPEYLSLIASIIDVETSFNTQGGEVWDQRAFNLAPRFLKDSVWTKKGQDMGCMDIKICKAIKIQQEITPDEDLAKKRVYDTITSQEGCVFYGEKYLSRVAESHLAVSGKFDEDTINKILSDYVAGEYASRNAALQKQLNELTGNDLTLDGDFLIYGDDCEISSSVSQTQRAAESFASNIQDTFNDNSIQTSQVRSMLTKEKTKEFENTLIYKKIKQYYKEKIGEPEYTILTQAPRYTGQTSESFVNEVIPNYEHYCREMCNLA